MSRFILQPEELFEKWLKENQLRLLEVYYPLDVTDDEIKATERIIKTVTRDAFLAGMEAAQNG